MRGRRRRRSIYNIGNNRPVPLLDMIATLERLLGRKAIIELLPMQAGEIPVTYANIDAIRRDFGFEPVTDIDEASRRFVDWFLPLPGGSESINTARAAVGRPCRSDGRQRRAVRSSRNAPRGMSRSLPDESRWWVMMPIGSRLPESRPPPLGLARHSSARLAAGRGCHANRRCRCAC